MSITLTKFFGASLTSFSSSVGWNEQSTTVTINLVEDTKSGDRFRPLNVGEPCSFACGKFQFQGILQRYLQTGSTAGNPLYEVMLMSPVEILAGAQVILSSFNGKTSAMPNLLNAFGYWEDRLGFGGAMTNDSGMVWDASFNILGLSTSSTGGSITIKPAGRVGIKTAIEALTAKPSDFGGPLQFRGHTYNVDLSSLPLTPDYYRIGGVAVSIKDMVNALCQDAGYDYICYLEGHTIKFKTVSRLFQPATGQIASFVNSRTDVVSKQVGVELRNDVTNAVLLGGDQEYLAQVYNLANDDTIWPFWGMDIDGKPIVGKGAPEKDHTFKLNATDIADIVGDTVYPCSIAELRFAAANFDSWAAYVLRWEPDKAETIKIVGAIDALTDLADMFGDNLFQIDAIAADEDAVKAFGEMNDNDYWTQRTQRVFEFVRRYAEEYFGRKFLVKLPFLIYWKAVPDTTEIISSDFPTNSGYVTEQSRPLGLDFFNEDIFMDNSGKFECFCKFPLADDIDIQKLSPGSCAISGDGIYVKAQVDTSYGILYPGTAVFPYCVVDIGENAVQQLAPDPLGGIPEIAAVLGFDPEKPEPVIVAASNRNGDFPIRIIPPYYRPIAVAVPMKSSRVSYGPWGTFDGGGAPGQVWFERDENMTPWEYGDIATLDLAAKAKLANAATNMQESDTGSVEMVGAPIVSLGDELISGGPNVTNITVSMSAQGVTTSYEMKTFTRQFGSFAKENADRLKRLGLAANQTRRAIRGLFHRREATNQIRARARMGFMENTSRAVEQRTPHDMMYGRMTFTKEFGYRTHCSFSTYPEAVANCRGDKKEFWEATGAMSLQGLLRPFSTKYNNPGPQPGTGDMPHYGDIKTSAITGVVDKIGCRKTLDPFGKGSDIEILVWGDEYPGEMHVKKAEYKSDPQNLPDGADPSILLDPPAYDKVRGMGLRSPLILVGWGYEVTGKPFPNAWQNPTDDDPDNPEKDSEDPSESNDPPDAPVPGAPAGDPKLQDWKDKFMKNRRKHPEKWKAGPLDVVYDTWRQCWTFPTILKGVMDEDINDGGNGLMKIVANGVTLDDKVKVYHDLGAKIVKDTKVVASFYPLENKWYITAARCQQS
jgi:hypothetical protein